jgi:hypothetical protein
MYVSLLTEITDTKDVIAMATNALLAQPRPIRVRDPRDGKVWSVPVRPTTRLDADVAERWFVNVALAAACFRSVVPLPFLAPDLRHGCAVLSLCRIRMRHAAPDWAPLALGPASDNCALRMGCIDTRDGSPAVWIDRRLTTHILGRVLRRLGFPPVEPDLVVRSGHPDALTLHARTGTLRCEVRPGSAAAPRLFADAMELTTWVTAGVRSYARAAVAGRFEVVDLEKGSPNVFVHLADCGGRLSTPWGCWPIDGAYRTIDGAYQWRVLGMVDAAGNVAARTTGAGA